MNQKYYDITKEYPDMFRITIYKSPYDPNKKRRQKVANLLAGYDDGSSIRRTRRVIHDLVKCNNFDLFVTFTFNPKKVDRYDISACYRKMQTWLYNQRRRAPDFKYLIVPEKHQDGAIHFHALMAEYTFDLKKTNVIQDSKRVYNVRNWRLGFTNATFIEDEPDKAVNYIAKYITKDMETLHNKRRYWSSKNLIKPARYINKGYDLGLIPRIEADTVPLAESDFNVTYQLRKLFD